jgi:hypothetical protein
MKNNFAAILLLLVSLNLFAQKEKFVSDLDTIYFNNGEKKTGYISISYGRKYIKKIKFCKKIKKDIFGRENGYGKCDKYSPEEIDADKIAFGFSAFQKKKAAKNDYDLVPTLSVIFKINTKNGTKYKAFDLKHEGNNYDFYEDEISYTYMSGNNMKTKYKYYMCLTKKGEKEIFKCFRSDNYKFYRKDLVKYFESCKSKLEKALDKMKLRDVFPYEIVDECGN